jgi:hypothetical protein
MPASLSTLRKNGTRIIVDEWHSRIYAGEGGLNKWCKQKQDPDHVSLSELAATLRRQVTLNHTILLGAQGKGILHKDGELSNFNCECTRKRSCAIRHVDREYSTRSIEAVVKANSDGHRWYQLYWYVPHPPDHTYCTVFPLLRCSKPVTIQRGGVLDPSSLAEAEGFTALVLTRYLPTRLVGLTTSTRPIIPALPSGRWRANRHV